MKVDINDPPLPRDAEFVVMVHTELSGAVRGVAPLRMFLAKEGKDYQLVDDPWLAESFCCGEAALQWGDEFKEDLQTTDKGTVDIVVMQRGTKH